MLLQHSLHVLVLPACLHAHLGAETKLISCPPQACQDVQEDRGKESSTASMTAAPSHVTEYKRIHHDLVQLLKQEEAREAQVDRREALVGRREALLAARMRQLVYALLWPHPDPCLSHGGKLHVRSCACAQSCIHMCCCYSYHVCNVCCR